MCIGQHKVSNQRHRETWVKVNAPVDRKVASLISILSSVPMLRTLESCQGQLGGLGFVYFLYGGWEKVCRFAFGLMAPALVKIDGTAISVEVFNASEPMAKLSFRAETIDSVTSALRLAITGQKYECSHGREYKAPRS